MAAGQQENIRMQQAFPREALLVLTVLGLVAAPVTALTAQAGKARTTTVGRIDDFSFLYSVQNQVASCWAQLVNAQGKTVAFKVRNGTNGNIYALALARPAGIEPGKATSVQITAIGASPWSGTFDGLAGPSDIEAAIANTSGLYAATGNFQIKVAGLAQGQWASAPDPLSTRYTSLKRIFDGLDLCLAGRQVS